MILIQVRTFDLVGERFFRMGRFYKVERCISVDGELPFECQLGYRMFRH